MPQELRSHNERFMALLKPYHDRLARFARAMTRSREEAEDLVGDTLLAALEHFEQLRHEEAFLSWLFSIASRLQQRRRIKARIFDSLTFRFGSRFDDEHAAEQGAEPEPPERGGMSPETFVDVHLLYEALERLPAKQREAFVMFEISGLSLAEIQHIQGDSLSAVKMRLVRARERLQELLGIEEEQPTPQKPRTANRSEATIHRLPEADASIHHERTRLSPF